MPRKERKLFAEDPWTKQQIGNTWSAVHGNIERTIPVDLEQLLDRTWAVREMSKTYSNFMDDMVQHDDTSDDPFHEMCRAILGEGEHPEHTIRRIKTGLVLALFILCMGIELTNSHLTEFWKPTGVDSADDPFELRPFERLEYLVDSYPGLFTHGPLLEMANMMSIQRELGGKMNRGALFDAMHSVYCYYCGNTITMDDHFIELKNRTDTKSYEGIIISKDYVSVHNLARERLSKMNPQNPRSS